MPERRRRRLALCCWSRKRGRPRCFVVPLFEPTKRLRFASSESSGVLNVKASLQLNVTGETSASSIQISTYRMDRAVVLEIQYGIRSEPQAN